MLDLLIEFRSVQRFLCVTCFTLFLSVLKLQKWWTEEARRDLIIFQNAANDENKLSNVVLENALRLS